MTLKSLSSSWPCWCCSVTVPGTSSRRLTAVGLNSFPRTWRKNNYNVSKEAIADVITANVWTCEAGSSDELDKKTFTRWVAYSMGSAVVTSHPFRGAGSVPLDVGLARWCRWSGCSIRGNVLSKGLCDKRNSRSEWPKLSVTVENGEKPVAQRSFLILSWDERWEASERLAFTIRKWGKRDGGSVSGSRKYNMLLSCKSQDPKPSYQKKNFLHRSLPYWYLEYCIYSTNPKKNW